MQCTQRNILSLGLQNLRRTFQSTSLSSPVRLSGGGASISSPTVQAQKLHHQQWPSSAASFSTFKTDFSTSAAAARAEEPKTASLPRLPVPPLNDTLAKFLRTVKPLLSDDEFARTSAVVKEFGTNPELGPKLQTLLENRAAQKDSWLADWWLSTAYLGLRCPVIINSSPGLIFPFGEIKSKEEQLNYAARLITAAINFKFTIDRHEIKQEYMGKNPLDMSQYYRIMGGNRSPAEPEDILTFNPNSRHIIVAYKNYFHKLEVIDEKGNLLPPDEILRMLANVCVQCSGLNGIPFGVLTGTTRDSWAKTYQRLQKDPTNQASIKAIDEKGNLLPPDEILRMLANVCVQCSGLNGIPFGVLTGTTRDSWAKTYQRLQKDPTNQASIKAIEESLFLVCIDRPNRPVNVHKTRAVTAIPEVEDLDNTERLTAAGLQMIHGNYTNAGNRWHDKTIQFVVGVDGEVGLTYEHSPAEGPPVAAMMDFIVTQLRNNIPPINLGSNTSAPKNPPIQLAFNLKDKKITKAIAEAKDNVDGMIQDLDLSCFSFKPYGKDFIKSCKFSPDSYIQMAIQAAYYRVHKVPAPHYESAATRMFLAGRTETIRSCSSESLEFSKGIDNPGLSLHAKYLLMKKAIETHKNYANDAVRGLGVDRHLLGLKKIALENGIKLPEFFQDPGYLNSQHYKLSTSQVASAYNGLMCYGPFVPDGYGCCYNPMKDEIIFGVSAFNSNTDTDSNNFKSSLQELLLDMQVIGHANVSKL